MSRFAALLLPAALIAAPAAAQDADDPYSSCAAITDNAQRLACFDATYAAQRVVIAERAEAEEQAREEVFGFREEDAMLEDANDESTLTVTVTEVLQGARRSQVLLLDNGQLWREIDGSTLRNLPRSVGSSVGISVVMTLAANETQRNHAELAAHVTGEVTSAIDLSSLDRYQQYGQTALAIADAEVTRQAAMIAYLNDFRLMSWLCLAAVPLVLLMRKSPRYGGGR